jgi:MerR family Zn(II)-responsive transcriptional regulator of zntA
MAAKMYKIGELARLAEVTPDTIRYYEKQGMMSLGERSDAGYRLYGDHDLQRLRFIRYAKTIGFTLETISELLSIRIDPEHHTCQESKEIVDSRLAEVEHKLSELIRMRDSLQRLSAACCGGAHSSQSCSIIEALENGASGDIANQANSA